MGCRMTRSTRACDASSARPILLGHVRPGFSLETVAANTARRRAERRKHLAGIHRVRHEPPALDMRHIPADQPPRRAPSAVRALTGDTLDASHLADVVVTERDEPARRRHLDREACPASL